VTGAAKHTAGRLRNTYRRVRGTLAILCAELEKIMQAALLSVQDLLLLRIILALGPVVHARNGRRHVQELRCVCVRACACAV